MKNQKGFIPILFIIIGAVVVASATLGVIYKDKITASVVNIFNKPQTEVLTMDSALEESEVANNEQPIEEPPIQGELEEPSPITTNKNQEKPKETSSEIQSNAQNQETIQETNPSEENFQEAIEELIKYWQDDIREIMAVNDRVIGLIDAVLSRISNIKYVLNGMHTIFGVSDGYFQVANNLLDADINLLMVSKNGWNEAKNILNPVFSYPIPTVNNLSEFVVAATNINNDFTALRNFLINDSQDRCERAEISLDSTEKDLDRVSNDLFNLIEEIRKSFKEIAAEEETKYQQIMAEADKITQESEQLDKEIRTLHYFQLEDSFLIWLDSCGKSPWTCEGYKPARPNY